MYVCGCTHVQTDRQIPPRSISQPTRYAFHMHHQGALETKLLVCLVSTVETDLREDSIRNDACLGNYHL